MLVAVRVAALCRMSGRVNRISFDYSGQVTSVIAPSARVGLTAFTEPKWREAAERAAGMASVRAKMWPASTRVGLTAFTDPKWREAAERAAGMASVRAKMWPASTKIDIASTRFREAAERAGLTEKMWPSAKINLDAVMGPKWREAAERAAGMASVRAKMWPASTKIDIASTRFREAAERAGLTEKMWPSAKINLDAVMGPKWREAAERAGGVHSMARPEAAASITPMRADAAPEVLAAAIALAWFATLIGYWLDELNRQGVSLAEVGRFNPLTGVAFMIETTRWVYVRALRSLRQHW